MQKLVIKMSRVCLFVALLCLSFQAQAATFVDLNEVTFSENKQQKKILRLVLFDIENQEYSHISYYNLSSGIALSPAPKRQLPLDPKFAGIKVFHDGTNGIIEVNGEQKDRYITRVPGVMIQGTITPRTSEEIRGMLSSFTGSAQTTPFKATTYVLKGDKDKEKQFIAEDEREFTELSSDKNANSIERGVLGELATEMTMTSFGCTRYLSQNASNHGLDGVYTTSDRHLFLTESKCHEARKSAEAFMGEDLNEGRIYGKLQAIVDPYLDTKALIEDFIAKTPQSIFKIVHRIKPNGKSQYCIQPFDLFLYKVAQPQSALISVDSSPVHKQLIFKGLRERIDLGKCIDLDFVEFIEGISGLSKEEIGMALMMSSLTPVKRQNVIGLFPVSEAKEEEVVDEAGEVLSPIPLSPTSVVDDVPPFVTPKKTSAKRSLTPAFSGMSLKEGEPKEDKSKGSKDASGALHRQPSDPLSAVKEKEEVVFAAYTLPKLKKLISLINNKEGKLGHKGIGRDTLVAFCKKYSQQTGLTSPMRDLLAGDNIASGKAELIWNTLTKHFEDFCKDRIGLDSRKKIIADLESIKE